MVRSAIDKLKQIEVYIKYKNKIFEKNGKALSCSNKIYQVLEKELAGMTKKAIQTSINRNATTILAANEAADENDNDNDVSFEFVPIEENVEADDTLESSHLLSESFDKEDSRSEQSAEASSIRIHTNESLCALYHKKTSQDQAQKEIEQVHKSIGNLNKFFADARNEIDTLAASNQEISRDFEASKDQLLTCKKSHSEHEEAAKEEMNELRDNNQKLLLEIATLTELNQQISRDYEASKNQLLTSEQCSSEQDIIVATLQSKNIELLEREKSVDEEMNKLRDKNQKLLLEIATLTELNQQISRDYEASKNQLLTSEQCSSEQDIIVATLQSKNIELLEREKSVDEEMNKLRDKNQKLLLEIATLTELNQQISRDYEASKNQLLASEQSSSEKDNVVATLEEHPSEPTVPSALTVILNATATDLVDQVSTSRLKTEANKRPRDDESCILDPNENTSSQNKRSRNRKLTCKYFGQEWSH